MGQNKSKHDLSLFIYLFLKITMVKTYNWYCYTNLTLLNDRVALDLCITKPNPNHSFPWENWLSKITYFVECTGLRKKKVYGRIKDDRYSYWCEFHFHKMGSQEIEDDSLFTICWVSGNVGPRGWKMCWTWLNPFVLISTILTRVCLKERKCYFSFGILLKNKISS